jgi:rhodanese-related sulfurtransferase
VTPPEVLALLDDRRVSIELFDLRDEAAYNRFHIADALRLDPCDLSPVRALPPSTVKVLVGDDEAGPLAVYRRLALSGTTGVYLLDGGVRGWLAAFSATSCRDHAACRAGLALGDRHPASRPPAGSAGKYVPKVKIAAGKKLSGGCGG